jgi:hypothetical protein
MPGGAHMSAIAGEGGRNGPLLGRKGHRDEKLMGDMQQTERESKVLRQTSVSRPRKTEKRRGGKGKKDFAIFWKRQAFEFNFEFEFKATQIMQHHACNNH